MASDFDADGRHNILDLVDCEEGSIGPIHKPGEELAPAVHL
jgi:hypothetical protein